MPKFSLSIFSLLLTTVNNTLSYAPRWLSRQKCLLWEPDNLRPIPAARTAEGNKTPLSSAQGTHMHTQVNMHIHTTHTRTHVHTHEVGIKSKVKYFYVISTCVSPYYTKDFQLSGHCVKTTPTIYELSEPEAISSHSFPLAPQCMSIHYLLGK